MRTKLVLACAAMAFVAIAGGTAEATGLIHTANIANGAITFDKLSPHVQKVISKKATGGTNGVNGLNGVNGAKGDTGATGRQGRQGSGWSAGRAGRHPGRHRPQGRYRCEGRPRRQRPARASRMPFVLRDRGDLTSHARPDGD